MKQYNHFFGVDVSKKTVDINGVKAKSEGKCEQGVFKKHSLKNNRL